MSSSKELWNAWLVYTANRRSAGRAVRELVSVYGYKAREAAALLAAAKAKHG